MSDSDVEIIEDDSEYEILSSDGGSSTMYVSDREETDLNQEPGTNQPSNYTIITPSELAKQQGDAMKGVQEILGCSSHEARRLLMHMRWTPEALFGAITDRGQDRVYEASGLPAEAPAQNPPDEGEITCQICFCDATPDEALTMDCGHTFCKDCWKGHCKVQITDGCSTRIKCMDAGCKKFCSKDKIRVLLVDEPRLDSRFCADLDSSYVDDNPNVCWCPSVPHCGNAVRAEKNNFCEPQCLCGHTFCFNCKDAPHSPCTCDMWEKWRKKCQDDSETNNWLTANTKPCPKCKKMVEKNGGCNLVYCTCGQTFCWLCGTATGRSHTWTTIEGHTCGEYKADLDKRIDEASKNVKRYLHYHTRWVELVKSAEEEKKAGIAITAKLAELEGSGVSGSIIDHSWVVQAYNQLYEVRKILANSYVFAFYMFSNTDYKEEISEEQNLLNQNLFEAQQAVFAVTVEHVSKLLRDMGKNLDEIDKELRLEVINMTKNLDKRLENLYHLIENDILSKLVISPNDISFYKGIRPTSNRMDFAANTPAKAKGEFSGLTESMLTPRRNEKSKRARLFT